MNEKKRRFVAVPSDFAASVRKSAAEGPRRAVVPWRDGKRHQCRHCLTLSLPEESVLLASYCPFSSDQPFAERGPVFVHERECERYGRETDYPAEFPKRGAALRAYDAADSLLAATVVGDRDVEEVIDELLDDPRVAYLHARNAAEGCFMFRIDRAG